MADRRRERQPSAAQVRRAMRGLPIPADMLPLSSEGLSKLWRGRAQNLNTRAMRAGASGRLSPTDLRRIVMRDGSRCRHCGCKLNYSIKQTPGDKHAATFDHLVRLTDGGAHAYPNVACSCAGCNNERH